MHSHPQWTIPVALLIAGLSAIAQTETRVPKILGRCSAGGLGDAAGNAEGSAGILGGPGLTS